MNRLTVSEDEKQLYKLVVSWKTNWLKNLTDNGGAQRKCISIKSDNDIVIKTSTKKFGNLWSVIQPEQLIKLTAKDHGIYEVISSFPHKVFFDIDRLDMNDVSLDYLKQMLATIQKYFPDADFAVSGSVGKVKDKDKSSYHVVINNYVISNKDEFVYLRTLVQYLHQNLDIGFDQAVYTTNRCMKCINQSKGDERVQKIIMNEDPKAHFITCFIPTNVRPYPDLSSISVLPKDAELNANIRKVRNSKKINLASIPVLSKPSTLLNIDQASPLELLSITPFGMEYPHTYTHRVARFCFHNGVPFEQFYSWYKQKSTEQHRYTKWQKHWAELHNYNNYNIKLILLQSYPKIRKDFALTSFVSLFDKHDNLPVKKINSIEPAIFAELPCRKCVALNIGMSAGKTEQTIRFLNSVPNFLWITPNIALSSNTHARINNEFSKNRISNCKHYQYDFRGNKQKMDTAGKLIICMNSIHYLEHRTYDYIIIDESESCFKNWINNSTIEDNKVASKKKCWNVFVKLLKASKHIICLDAFTSNITLDLLSGTTNDLNQIMVYERVEEVSNRSFCEIDINTWRFNLIRSLKQGKRLFIFYPYLNMSASRKIPSMAKFKEILTTKTGKSGIMYNSLVDDEVVKTLCNVNDVWSQYDFVITNTKITVGVNYDLQDTCSIFDQVFLLVAPFNSARDINQVSCRCRTLKVNEILVAYDQGLPPRCDFHNDKELINDPIYSALYDNVLKEKVAPLRESVQFFCQKAGYKILQSDKEISDSIRTEMAQLFKGDEEEYPYDEVYSIRSYEELEKVQYKLYAQTATVCEKLAIQKFFFELKFKKGTDLKDAWSGRYFVFFNKMDDLRQTPNNLLENIKSYNKWSSICPSDKELNKVKLSNEIIEIAFKQIVFQSASKTSSSKVLVKRIYNVVFDRNVISSRQDGNNHYELFIDEDTKSMFELGFNFLRSYQEDVIPSNQEQQISTDDFINED